jgi:hypothetical protein
MGGLEKYDCPKPNSGPGAGRTWQWGESLENVFFLPTGDGFRQRHSSGFRQPDQVIG